MIKQIMVNGGPWPPPKDELITKHLKAFLSFVKLIDFQKLNLFKKLVVLTVHKIQNPE